MPKYFNENGTRTRYWTDEELKARYQQGRQDAGDKHHEQRFSEGDLKNAFDSGVKKADRLLGSAVRGGFEDGFKAGENEGQEKGKQAAIRAMPQNILDAERIGFERGQREGYQEGNDTAQRRFARDLPYIQKDAVENYKRNHSLPARLTWFYDELTQQGTRGSLAAMTHVLGKLPLGPDFDAPRNHMLRLADFRTNPRVVSRRFLGLYILGPLVAYQALSYPYNWLSNKKSQYDHGETGEQFASRQKVAARCNQLEQITPRAFGLTAFPQVRQADVDHCKAQCQKTQQNFEKMRETMAQRRRLGIGNQLSYGLRLFDGFQDRLEHQGTPGQEEATVIADNNLAERIEHLFDELTTPKMG